MSHTVLASAQPLIGTLATLGRPLGFRLGVSGCQDRWDARSAARLDVRKTSAAAKNCIESYMRAQLAIVASFFGALSGPTARARERRAPQSLHLRITSNPGFGRLDDEKRRPAKLWFTLELASGKFDRTASSSRAMLHAERGASYSGRELGVGGFNRAAERESHVAQSPNAC
jgi:hypothetical protein